MDKNIRLAGILSESLVNGNGLRRVYFSQGCKHNCKGCFNPHTHNFNDGILLDMDTLIKDVKSNPMITGITFSGGDPLEQADKFAYMAYRFKKLGLSVWCYTGYEFEYILKNKFERNGWTELLNNVDVLIDGKFIEELKNNNIKFRGSSNQRLINIQESLKQNKIILLQE